MLSANLLIDATHSKSACLNFVSLMTCSKLMTYFKVKKCVGQQQLVGLLNLEDFQMLSSLSAAYHSR